MFIILTQTLIITLIIILLLWLYSILINDVSIIDIAFAPLVLTITLVSIYLSNSSFVFQVLIFFIILGSNIIFFITTSLSSLGKTSIKDLVFPLICIGILITPSSKKCSVSGHFAEIQSSFFPIPSHISSLK